MPDADDRPQDSAKAKTDAIALAEEAEAEAAEAEALAAAARARARAMRLRRQAQAEDAERETTAVAEAADVSAETTAVAEAADVSTETPEAPEPAPRPALSGRVRTVLTVAVVAVICALLGASGWMIRHHHGAVADQQRSAAFAAAARQGVINLTSLDFNNAKRGVQRILDSSTGEFRDDFQRRADDFASVVQTSKVVTEGSVAAAAVESMRKDSAVVLVLATERVTNSAGAKDEPRSFRFRVSVAQEGDQMKISKVEFVL